MYGMTRRELNYTKKDIVLHTKKLVLKSAYHDHLQNSHFHYTMFFLPLY